MKNLVLTLITIFVIAACGGGGSSEVIMDPPPPVGVNTPPTADAGDDFTAPVSQSISMAGQGTDPENNISSFSWTQTSGPEVNLTNANSSTASFVAPNNDATLEFDFTVTDSEGLSDTDTVVINVKSQFNWSENTAWHGSTITSNSSVIIPEGITVTVDEPNIEIKNLTVDGTLRFSNINMTIRTDWIMVHGSLFAGSEQQRFTNELEIILTGLPGENVMNMGSRGIFVHNGIVKIYGKSNKVAWTKLNQDAEIGAQELTLASSNGWSVGDEIIITPTDFYEFGRTEKSSITSINNNSINIEDPLNKFHWGKLQYATANGISLVNDNSINPPANAKGYNTPLTIDQRAEVANLTRNIKVTSADDIHWTNSGFGAQIMVMGSNAELSLNGVEINRAGQLGQLGRYPIHFHKLSYDESGTRLPNVQGSQITNSVIQNSKNRCITIHATNGLMVDNNICYNILGHAVFFEDAVERENVVTNNLIAHVSEPSAEEALLINERNFGPSGIWLTNPDNTVTGNTVSDVQGTGIWLAFPDSPLGDSKNVDIIPNRTKFGSVNDNTVHSVDFRGFMLDLAQIDDLGNVDSISYASGLNTGDSSCIYYENSERFEVRGLNLWKNSENLWNRDRCPDFVEIVNVDSNGKFFAGFGSDGLVTASLVVGHSLNDRKSEKTHLGPPTAFATYHSTFRMTENVVINFPNVEGKTSGVFATEDYYLRPVEKGLFFNTSNLIINSHYGHRSDAAVNEEILNNFAQGNDYYKFAGAIWDPHGFWGPKGTWSVYDTPFFTHGISCTQILPVSQNASSCDGNFYGVQSITINNSNSPFQSSVGFSVERLSREDLSKVGEWSIPKAPSANAPLANMRHFATVKNGVYKLQFIDEELPNEVLFSVLNVTEVGDSFILGIEFNGSKTPRVYATTRPYPFNISSTISEGADDDFKKSYLPRNSYNELDSSNAGGYWQDKDNNMIWLKIYNSDLNQIDNINDPFAEESLYGRFFIRVW